MKVLAIILNAVFDEACVLTNHAGTCFIMRKWVNSRLCRRLWIV